MQPLEILRRVPEEKLDAILSELNSGQIKRVLKTADLSTRVPASAVSPSARRRALARRVRDGIAKDRDDLASELLYQWLLNHRRQMLVDYLEAIEVKHVNGETEETFTKTVPEDKLIGAALGLRGSYEPMDVAIYVLYLDHHQEADVYSHDDRILGMLRVSEEMVKEG